MDRWVGVLAAYRASIRTDLGKEVVEGIWRPVRRWLNAPRYSQRSLHEFGCLLSRHFQLVSSFTEIDLLAVERGELSMLDDHFRSVPAVVLQVEAIRAAVLSIEL